MRRGRPPKEETLVPLMVMVRPQVKEHIRRAAEVEGKSMGQYTREILDRW